MDVAYDVATDHDYLFQKQRDHVSDLRDLAKTLYIQEQLSSHPKK